ncbi:MAG TPA: hypothetical protein VNC50_17380 [Planctomycetia bacterium]|nr:hypothetical protein [Planctomycetia bacterium]
MVAEIRSVPFRDGAPFRAPWEGETESIITDGQFSRNGLFARIETDRSPPRTVVTEYRTGRLVFADPPPSTWTDESIVGRSSQTPPILSPDGRFLLDRQSNCVWSVSSGRKLWEWADGLFPMQQPTVDFGKGLVEVTGYSDSSPALKLWNERIGTAIPALKFKDGWREVRDLSSGRLHYRCDEDTIDCFSSSGAVISSQGVAIDETGIVRRLGPVPRWGLIAILQAILAAPLVGLWGLLRWRKWRMTRAVAP